ncbi:hypothetical protein CHLNCDRAFT_54763 [Chlorella variabilis]|uniref:Glycoside hydrolase family 38 N-terminal domain-containing protein n=1 Tax=Chlorella variabilis TaxID=554065 RepID=E1ZQC8_CHLVA|nr:hypothetical protein CHLNCDRAFT_54763 [Chlorella variabilis]EFN51908.1 hypothetical protein CHLNCDRAFT_54763 [Chlorella variabilis]|eukprot:XP_005844010.1 hypothetical protein CHLNCDRAFT_54763 [Chlorella variabilis]
MATCKGSEHVGFKSTGITSSCHLVVAVPRVDAAAIKSAVKVGYQSRWDDGRVPAGGVDSTLPTLRASNRNPALSRMICVVREQRHQTPCHPAGLLEALYMRSASAGARAGTLSALDACGRACPPAPRPPLCCGLCRALLLLACLAAAAKEAAAAFPAPGGAANITKVTLVVATHLDVGYHSGGPEPGYDNNTLSRYFNTHFPRAVRVARQLRQRPGGTERLVFLTHSWLVSLFLDCPTHIGLVCPNATTVADFKAAVHRGDITWHALPHNAQVELYDADLLRFAVSLTHDLDRAFHLPPKITASQRDVPGLTRAAVPILADQGVRAISVGVNGGCAPPAVPHFTPFIWRDLPSGKELLAMWHPGGYSGTPVDGRWECVKADGLSHALCAAWSGDNSGPPDADEVLDIYARLRADFPGADIVAGGFDGFVADVLAAAPRLDLPVVTGEIGDTWIHGAAADPAKLAEYRALLRLPEHTAGVDQKEYPNDWEHWGNAAFHRRLANTSLGNPFAVAVHSWVRQRSYNRWAVQELGNSQEGLRAQEALSALQRGRVPPTPHAPSSGFQRRSLQEPLLFQSLAWQLELSSATGAIVGLHFKESDFNVMWEQYAFFETRDDWFAKDFSKPNSTLKGGARHAAYLPQAEEVWWRRNDDGGLHITVKSAFERYAVQSAGAPKVLWTEIRALPDTPDLLVDLVWEGKAPTRLAEAFWVTWIPRQQAGEWRSDTWGASNSWRWPLLAGLSAAPLPCLAAGCLLRAVNISSWLMWKLGQPISPLEVIRNGSHGLHAVGDEGVSVDSADGKRRLYIRSLDAALVSPVRHTPFPSLSTPPDLRHGVSYCLTNNIWGTNYAMWNPYLPRDASMRFRFVLQLEILPAVQAHMADA